MPVEPQKIRDIWQDASFQALLSEMRAEICDTLTMPVHVDAERVLEKRRDLLAFQRIVERIEAEAAKAG